MHKTASLLLIMTSSQIYEWWTGLCYLEGFVTTHKDEIRNLKIALKLKNTGWDRHWIILIQIILW